MPLPAVNKFLFEPETHLNDNTTSIQTTSIKSLPLLLQGKVRDVYAVGDDHLLMIATDRLSAFDVVLPEPLPGKGKILTQLALFWFEQMADLIPNHLATELSLAEVLPDPGEYAQAKDRSMLVKRLKPLPVEAVVRGYLIGSGWKDYQQSGSVCDVKLPANMQLAEQIDPPIFTPATKAEVGDHDINISAAAMADIIGTEHADAIESVSKAIYQRASAYCAKRGIILADTKFEFGLDANQQLTLMDEILTPDSSRFWNASSYNAGQSPESYDKQFVRDYLETLDWNKAPPGPSLPDEIKRKTMQRYEEALSNLTN